MYVIVRKVTYKNLKVSACTVLDGNKGQGNVKRKWMTFVFGFCYSNKTKVNSVSLLSTTNEIFACLTLITIARWRQLYLENPLIALSSVNIRLQWTLSVISRADHLMSPYSLDCFRWTKVVTLFRAWNNCVSSLRYCHLFSFRWIMNDWFLWLFYLPNLAPSKLCCSRNQIKRKPIAWSCIVV